jgi:hypothetical protein
MPTVPQGTRTDSAIWIPPERREMLAVIGKVLIVPKNELAEFMSRVTDVVWEPLDDLAG